MSLCLTLCHTQKNHVGPMNKEQFRAERVTETAAMNPMGTESVKETIESEGEIGVGERVAGDTGCEHTELYVFCA